MSKNSRKILISWVARSNDPYEWDAKNGVKVEDSNNNPVYGPTLTLLLDPESSYSSINKAYIFYRAESDVEALNGIRNILSIERPNFQINALPWKGNDPTDHKALFNFLQPELKRIRGLHPDNELIINVSPGTPAMHTVWVLLAEVGYISQPLALVQCRRWNERFGCPPVENISIGIENYLKIYQDTIDRLNEPSDLAISWNPLDFRSEKLRMLEREARRFAKVKTPVLILGERGTGKSTWAAWIRTNSPFQNKTNNGWDGVVCGQFTSELMRSELFGHTKGAFSGAINNKVGLLKRMDKDTLFLDEIGDLDRETQRLLIKALEEKTFLPLGGEEPVDSDFRLIAATNCQLDVLKKENLYEDFFDRISYLVLTIPPLREIPEDIPWIWTNVYSRALSLAAVNRNKAIFGKVNHAAIVNRLQDHSLPGNYRDLYRVAHRLIAYLNDCNNQENPEDAVHYALSTLQPDTRNQPVIDLNSRPKLVPGFSLVDYLAKERHETILHALEQASGNQRKAASLLGVAPQAINKFIKTK